MNIFQEKSEPIKQSKPSQDCTCDLCSKVMTRRGLFNHLRLKHQMSNDEARETTRRILQNTPYAYKGVKRLLTVSIDNTGKVKLKSGIQNEAELFVTLKEIERKLGILIIIRSEDGAVMERYTNQPFRV
jgi:hypothetical protein